MNRDLFSQAGFITTDSNISDEQVTVYGQQISYRDNDVAIERMGRIMASELPDSVKQYKVVNTNGSVPLVQTQVDAEAFKREARYETVTPDIQSTYQRQDIQSDTLANYDPANTTGFFTGIETFWVQTFGNPEDFYLYQAGILANGCLLYTSDAADE